VGNYVFYNTYSATGLSGQKKSQPFNVYPNPVENIVTIEFDTKGDHQVKLTNPEGKILLNKKFQGQKKITCSLNRFSTATGFYLLSVENPEGKSYSRKIFVK